MRKCKQTSKWAGNLNMVALLLKNMSESSFLITLDSPSQKRYNEKIELIENKDPYTLSENEFSVDYDNLPSIYSL